MEEGIIRESVWLVRGSENEERQQCGSEGLIAFNNPEIKMYFSDVFFPNGKGDDDNVAHFNTRYI